MKDTKLDADSQKWIENAMKSLGRRYGKMFIDAFRRRKKIIRNGRAIETAMIDHAGAGAETR